MWYYTLWLTIVFFADAAPKHYIIWLLVNGVLLAVVLFAFSLRLRCLAVRQASSLPLLATALIVPYLKRSARVKTTFVNCNNPTVNLLSPFVVV